MTVYTLFGIIAAAALVLTILRYFIAKPANLFINYLQNFVGALFVFSGFVKAVDPLGTSYKMHEYFEAFAQEGFRPVWEWLATLSTPQAIGMIALELFIGLMLLLGWQTRFTIAIVWWLTLFFTYLTGYTYLSGYCISKTFLIATGLATLLLASIAVPASAKRRNELAIAAAVFIVALFSIGRFTDLFMGCAFTETKMKVTDCGCFGDFMKLKPWETFWKDVILDVIILILVLGQKHITPVFSKTLSLFTATATAIASTVFCWYYTYQNEPMIDFRPYAVGENVRENRITPKLPEIEMLFNYKNKTTGEVKGYKTSELSSLNYDELEFVDRTEKVLDPGIPAKISNLRIENENGEDITEALLTDENYSFMVVMYNIKKTNEAAYTSLNKLAAEAEKSKYHFYAVTVNDGKVEEFRHRNQTAFPFYYADETPLKTIIRSNPGLVLYKNGVVIAKWHYKHLPTFDEIKANYLK